MERLLADLPNLRIREKICDDDSIDQLHHFVTVYIFVIFSLIIGLKEYAGTPIDCWVTSHAWKHFQDHANTYCWTHRLYRYPNWADLREVQLLFYVFNIFSFFSQQIIKVGHHGYDY